MPLTSGANLSNVIKLNKKAREGTVEKEQA